MLRLIYSCARQHFAAPSVLGREHKGRQLKDPCSISVLWLNEEVKWTKPFPGYLQFLDRASTQGTHLSFASAISLYPKFHSASKNTHNMSNSRLNPPLSHAASSGSSAFASARSYARSASFASARSNARSSARSSARSNIRSSAAARSAAGGSGSERPDESGLHPVIKEALQRTYVCDYETAD